MAWRAQITDVVKDVPGTDAAGNPITVDVSLQGRFVVRAKYFDTAAPAVTLHTQSFDFPHTISRQDAADRVIAEGQRVRDARVRVTELQADVGRALIIP